jgi:urease accessory protein
MAQLTGLKLALGGSMPEGDSNAAEWLTRGNSDRELVRIETLPDASTDHLEIVLLELSCADRRRVRRRLIAPDGLELGLALPTGTVLEPGTVLHASDTQAYVIAAALEDVVVIRPENWAEAVKLAHQIGNLHRDIQAIGGDEILVLALWDAPLELLLLRLGATFERTARPFLGRPSWEH